MKEYKITIDYNELTKLFTGLNAKMYTLDKTIRECYNQDMHVVVKMYRDELDEYKKLYNKLVDITMQGDYK